MKKFIIVLSILAVAGAAHADLLAAWDFSGYGGDEGRGTSTVVNASLEDPAYITRGSGITAAGNANRFNANSYMEPDLAGAINNNDYFEWTVTADPGNSFSVTNFTFTFQRSATGPAEWTLRSSLDGYGSDLADFSALANGTYSTNLNLANQNSITFRFYGYGNTTTQSAGSAGFEGTDEDLILYGTVIPEPTTVVLMLAGFAGIAFVRWRKNR